MHPAIYIGLGTALLFFAFKGKKKFSRALVVGDSHSEASWTLGGQLKDKLQAAGLTSKVVGNRGKGVPWYLSTGTLSSELGSFRPDLLVVALGANDAGQYNEPGYKAALTEFVQTADSSGVQHIIWLGPSKSEGSLSHKMPARQQIAAWQQETLPPLGVEWHDSMPMTLDLTTRDGVHYREAEYAVWAARAGEVILDGVAVA